MPIESFSNNVTTADLEADMLGFIAGADSDALSIYDFLFKPIRDLDAKEGALFLKRYLAGPQALWDDFVKRARALPRIWSLTDAPDAALPFLKSMAGWTDELRDITDRLAPLQLRRLLLASASIWRERGSEGAWPDVIALLTGSRATALTWHDVRYILDESSSTEDGQGFDTWLFEAPGDSTDEFFSNVRVADDGTGSLDRQLVIDVLRLLRPLGERIIVSWVSLIDEFTDDDDRAQWADGAGSVSVASGRASLSDSATAESLYASAPLSAAWTDTVTFARLRGTGTFGVALRAAGDDDRYKVALDVAANLVKVSKVVGGTETPLASAAPPVGSLYTSVYYGLRVEVAGDDVRVFLDGDLALEVTDSAIVAGTAGFWHSAGGTVDVDTFEVAPIPMSSFTISP